MERLKAVNQGARGRVNSRLKSSLLKKSFFSCRLCFESCQDPSGFCRVCIADLPENKHFCRSCCKPLLTGAICGKCLISPSIGSDLVLAAYRYEYPINRLLSDVKFNRDPATASGLGSLAARWLIRQTERRPRPDAIIPVPLHQTRLRQRGFNQSLLLARPVSVLLNIPIVYRGYERIIYTLPQTDLDARARRKNVRGSFRCRHMLHGKHVVIFDDVVTTGATTEAFAKALRGAGADKVEIWALAKRALDI